MTLKELLQDPLVKLPKKQERIIPAVSFRSFLFNLLDNYLKKVKILKLDGAISAASGAAEKIRVEQLVEGIKASIESYLNGQPYKAYEELNKSFTWTRLISDLRLENFISGNSFYRLRKEEANYALQKGQLFHIPFNMRGEVSTMRYSIPGFPCLYFSDSVYVAWEEMRRPSLNKIQAVRLQNISDLKVVDLTTDIYLGEDSIVNSKSSDELWNHLFLWPLVAACSIKVLSDEAKFKPEYIIPQLLLQIVRGNDDLHGIMFSSTHVDRNKAVLKGSFLNFAIPVKENSDDGHCKRLLDIFHSTNPIPWEISEVFSNIKLPGMFIGSGHTGPGKLKVKSIQLDEGKDIPYEVSPFGRLENKLLDMTPGPIG